MLGHVAYKRFIIFNRAQVLEKESQLIFNVRAHKNITRESINFCTKSKIVSKDLLKT